MEHYPCAVCGKEVKKPKLWVETEYSGFYPIGRCCAMKYKGKKFTEKELHGHSKAKAKSLFDVMREERRKGIVD